MSRVTYAREGSVGVITMDDGKVNALSPEMQGEINAAFDEAEKDQAIVVLAGRQDRFSAGFDLNVLRSGAPDALTMLRGGFELAYRMLSFPRPIVIACTGHAIAMGSFLLLSGDYRIGAAGTYKIVANEVAIGLTLPLAATEICRHRLNPAAFDRATILAEPFSPEDAVAAGFLDRVVPAGEVLDTALATANGVSSLDMNAHAATKLRARGPALEAIRSGIEQEFPA